VIEQLILARHGETLHNVAGIAQGWQDSDLSERGLAQVRRLGNRIMELGADALFSSPLGRAISTAEAIREMTGLPIEILDDLREMNYGEWEGRSFLDVRKEYADAYHRWISEVDFACPEGESHSHVLERMKRAFEVVKRAKRPVIVSHGTAIRIGATALLNAPLDMARNLAQDNAAVNLFVWRSDRFVLKAWNETGHWRSALTMNGEG
jgi:probable phosphoglycerate mutase